MSDAVRLLELALSQLDSAHGDQDRLRARILLSLAFPQHELGLEERALSSFAAAEALAERGGHADIEVLVLAQRGALHLRSGRVAESLAELDRAAKLLDHAPGVDQFKILLNRSELHGMLGHLARAKTDSARAAELATRFDLGSLGQYATHNLGLFEFLSGHLPQALDTMPAVEEMSNDYERGVVGTDRAKVLLAAGLASEADQALAAACDALARTELVQFLAEAELTRAEVALLSGNVGLATQLSQQAVERLHSRSNLRATALGELVRLRAQVAAGADDAAVVGEADRLVTSFSGLGLPNQRRMAQLIALRHERTRTATPDDLPRVTARDPLDLRLYSRLVRAELAFGHGRRSTGRRQARLGLAELAEHQTQFGSLDLQTSSAAHGVALARLAISEEVANGRPGAVLDWLERARAISTRVPEVRPPEDEESANLLGQLRWVINQIEAQQAEGRNADTLDGRRVELQRTIRARSWTISGPQGGAVEIPSRATIRVAVGVGTLVAIFPLHDQLHGIVLTSTSCWLRPLGQVAEVEQAALRVSADNDVLAMDLVSAPLRTAASRSLARGLARLDELLIVPLDLPAGPVVLLPSGRFAGLPWGRLPCLTGRPVTVAPSAAAWMRAHANANTAPGPVTAVAGPGLARAEQEVNEVAATWPDCHLLVGAQARGESVLSAMDGGRVVHVAAHGRHQPDSPLFSSIKLFDGPLVGYDLERLRRPPQQVVLSACDLGQATVRPGDEALGLTRALLHSGTSTVISGVAKVSDRGAADLMVDYHRRLAAGSPPAYALADSLAATDEPLPFVCFGAGW